MKIRPFFPGRDSRSSHAGPSGRVRAAPGPPSAGEAKRINWNSVTAGPISDTVERERSRAMTITLNDEQARLLSAVVKAGAARSPDDAVDQAVRALHSS